MSRTVLLSTGLIARLAVLWLAALCVGNVAGAVPNLSMRDRAIIGEAYNLWSCVADGIWPGASAINIPFIYVGEEYEYAIGFPAALDGFIHSDEALQGGRNLQMRKRTLGRDLSASFPIGGVPAVVMGSPEALGKNIGEWVVTAGHEMFHVFQAAKGGYEKTAALEIAPRNDSSWQLNFPFPYAEPDVMRLMHLQGYLVWLTWASTDADDARYNIGTALEAVQVYRSRLAQGLKDDKAYRYSEFQEWEEGVAAYTEFRLAEGAAQDGYRPTQAYSSLPGFQTYPELWRSTYQGRPFLAKHAGRASKSRTAFYHLGMGKALALDRVSPGWKEKYFVPGMWLDDLLAAAVAGAH